MLGSLERGNHRIGAYFPQTISSFLWYSLKSDDSRPNDIAVSGDYVWWTGEASQRVGRLAMLSSAVAEYGVNQGSLGGIAADVAGHVWFAERDAGAIGEWRPPHFHLVFLPLLAKM